MSRGAEPRPTQAPDHFGGVNKMVSAEFLLYETEDGRTRVECRFISDSVWLTQAMMAELFQVTVPTVNEHLKTLYADGEIQPQATIRLGHD